MTNMAMLVGRLTENPTLEDGKETITLAVPRAYKNEDGIYETDFIPVRLWGAIAKNVCEYVKKGDLVEVKGRMQCQDNNLIVVAEKVSFLSSRSEQINKEMEN